MKTKIIFAYSSDRGFRVSCIDSFISIDTKKYILNPKTKLHSYLYALYFGLLLLFPSRKLIITVSYDFLFFTSTLLTYFPWTRQKIVIDFYDIFSLRRNVLSEEVARLETSIYLNAKYFIARSFELKLFRTKIGAKVNKKFIFLPDILFKDSNEALKSISNNRLDRLVLLGGIGNTHLEKLGVLANIRVDVFLPPRVNAHDLILAFGKPISKNIEINPGINEALFSETLSKYLAGLVLIEEGENIFNFSAASKYMAYLEAGIFILTDPRHRIAKWYARYFMDRIIFIDDNAMERLTTDLINKTIKTKLLKTPMLYRDSYLRLSAKTREGLESFLLR
jgi:hypothetical protein